MEWIQVVMAVLNGVIIILFLARELYWGKKFAESKEAQIDLKEEKIQYLERQIEWVSKFNPKAIDEYYSFAVTKLEEINGGLNTQVEALQSKMTEKESEISRLREAGEAHSEKIKQLSSELEALKSERNKTQFQADQIDELVKGTAVIRGSVKDAVEQLELELPKPWFVRDIERKQMRQKMAPKSWIVADMEWEGASEKEVGEESDQDKTEE